MTAATGAPLVATIHATEVGRHQGWLPAPLNRAIDSVERWLVADRGRGDRLLAEHGVEVAAAVRPAGRHGRAERHRPRALAVVAPPSSARRAREYGRDEPTLVFAGRLVHEKGVQLVLRALPTLRRRHPGLRFAVAGTGPYEPELRELARTLRVQRERWTGSASPRTTRSSPGSSTADAVVVPSLYEPFGIVALEAAAARTPLVAADTGGLHDAVAAGLTAAHFAPGDVAGLVRAVDEVLADPAAAARTARARAAARRARVQLGRGRRSDRRGLRGLRSDAGRTAR